MLIHTMSLKFTVSYNSMERGEKWLVNNILGHEDLFLFFFSLFFRGGAHTTTEKFYSFIFAVLKIQNMYEYWQNYIFKSIRFSEID